MLSNVVNLESCIGAKFANYHILKKLPSVSSPSPPRIIIIF